MSRRIEQATEIPAAQQLLAYIRSHFESGGIPEFAEKNGLDRLKVQRAITTLKRIDVDFAFAIQAATGGEVKAEDWRLPDPADPDALPASEPKPDPAKGSAA
jgi:hypothetical protein